MKEKNLQHVDGGAEQKLVVKQEAELFRKNTTKRQSLANSGQDAGMVVNRGTLSSSRTSVRRAAGVGRVDQDGAVICTVRRNPAWLR